jgi:hypothetical protein
MIISQTHAKTLSETERFWTGNIEPVQKPAYCFSDGALDSYNTFGWN